VGCLFGVVMVEHIHQLERSFYSFHVIQEPLLSTQGTTAITKRPDMRSGCDLPKNSHLIHNKKDAFSQGFRCAHTQTWWQRWRSKRPMRSLKRWDHAGPPPRPPYPNLGVPPPLSISPPPQSTLESLKFILHARVIWLDFFLFM
jgi:hypothetical protein